MGCRVLAGVGEVEEYKEALLYGNSALGLTGSILVVSFGTGTGGMAGGWWLVCFGGWCAAGWCASAGRQGCVLGAAAGISSMASRVCLCSTAG